MSIKTFLQDSVSGNKIKITNQNQLVVGPLNFSTPMNNLLGIDNTPAQLVPPKASHFIIITDLILTANRNIGINDATVTLYESNESAVAQGADDRTVFSVEMAKNSSLPLTGLNWKVNTGKFLNGVTNDDDVFVNLACYYAPI